MVDRNFDNPGYRDTYVERDRITTTTTSGNGGTIAAVGALFVVVAGLLVWSLSAVDTDAPVGAVPVDGGTVIIQEDAAPAPAAPAVTPVAPAPADNAAPANGATPADSVAPAENTAPVDDAAPANGAAPVQPAPADN